MYQYPKINEARQIARQLGLDPSRLHSSDKAPYKLYYEKPSGKRIYFGHREFQDFLMHGDMIRRKLYQDRAAGQKNKNGQRAIDSKLSPAWFSYHLLWP